MATTSQSPSDAIVSSPDVRVHRTIDLAHEEARARYGGLDVPAVLAGVLAGIGTAAVLAAALGALGATATDTTSTDDLALGAAVAAVVTLFLSFLVGGWVAGRMARYDGGRNGIATAVLFLLLVAGAAALSAASGEASQLLVSLGVRQPTLDSGPAIAVLVATVLAVLAAGFLGGKVGERWHRKADALVAGTRAAAIGTPATTVVRPGAEVRR